MICAGSNAATRRIGERWQTEVPLLHPLPAHAFACCTSREVTLNGYGQVSLDTNRYSVPADKARKGT